MAAQIITFDQREKLTEDDCAVGNFVLAGGEAWVHPATPGRIRRVVRTRVGTIGGAAIFVEATFERWWTSEEQVIYCWWRVK